jgi:homoserine dehydrogenase
VRAIPAEPRTRGVLLIGLGHVGRSFLRILGSQAQLLAERYGVAFRVVGAADSGGVAAAAEGLDPAAVLALKERGESVAALPGGRAGIPATIYVPHGNSPDQNASMAILGASVI